MDSQPTLDQPDAAANPPRVLVPTNRYNLLEILSSGLITPREGYAKYYADPVASAPGRIVAVSSVLTDDVCEAASAEGEASFPVAVELDASRLADAPVEALDLEGRATQARVGAPDVLAWAPSTVLPCSLIAAVHFRSEDELLEHNARGYANVVDDLEVRATPELFGGPAGRVLDWIEALPESKAAGFSDELTEADRYAGLAAMIAAALPGRPKWLLDWAQCVKAKRAPKRLEESSLPSWLAMALASGKPASQHDEVFAAILSTLRSEQSGDSWAPSELLEAIRAALPADVDDHVAGLVAEIGAVIGVEQDFRQMDPQRDPAEVAGLLLFLLRPDPAELLSWPVNETGADDSATLTAAAYSGLWHGYKRLPRALKPEGLHRLLAARAAARIDCPDKLWDWTPPKFNTVEAEAPEPVVGLKGGRAILFERPKGSVDVVNAFLTRPVEEIEGAALEVCRLRGWHDCVYTVVRAKSSRVRAEVVDGEPAVEVTLRGFVAPEHSLDLERFRERVAAEGVGDAGDAASALLKPEA